MPLVDIEPRPMKYTEEQLARVKASVPEEDPRTWYDRYKPERLQRGVYIGYMQTFFAMTENLHDEWDDEFWFRQQEGLQAFMASVHNGTYYPSYGVCDSPEQFMEKIGHQLEASPQDYMVELIPLTPETSPGWRWHKNGEYIGTQEPMAEHLGDESVIKLVYSFGIYRRKEKKEG